MENEEKKNAICICGLEMKKGDIDITVERCYGSDCYDKSLETQEGWICSCGIQFGKTGVVYKNKTYPYWKYGSDHIKRIEKNNIR